MAGTPTLPPLLTFRGNGVGVDGSNGKKSRNLLKNVVAVVSPGGAMRPFHGSHPLVSLFLSLGVSAVVSVDLFMTAELPPRRNAHRIATQLENWYAENSEDLSLTEETVYVLCGYSTGGWMMTLLAGMQPRPVSLSFMKNILLAPIGTMLRPREGNHADLVLAFWTERYQRTDKERLKFMEANHGDKWPCVARTVNRYFQSGLDASAGRGVEPEEERCFLTDAEVASLFERVRKGEKGGGTLRVCFICGGDDGVLNELVTDVRPAVLGKGGRTGAGSGDDQLEDEQKRMKREAAEERKMQQTVVIVPGVDHLEYFLPGPGWERTAAAIRTAVFGHAVPFKPERALGYASAKL